MTTSLGPLGAPGLPGATRMARKGLSSFPSSADHSHGIFDGTMVWAGQWETGTMYQKGDVVVDGDWLMIANKDTNARPAPQPIGEPFYTYDGAEPAPTDSQTVKQIVFGNRWTVDVGGFVSGFRLWTIIGNTYQMFVLRADGSFDVIGSIHGAIVTGWTQYAVQAAVFPPGSDFALVCVVTEPDPTPTTWVGNWEYDTPGTPDPPGTGVIEHANQTPDELRINMIDDDAGDRETELLALVVGDTVSALGATWSIQAVSDDGTYVTLSVTPSMQASPDGVTEFTFTTVTATPIEYLEDTNYWTLNPVSSGEITGLLGLSAASMVESDEAYGLDILIQPASVSDDWDYLGQHGGAGGSGGDVYLPLSGGTMEGTIEVPSPFALSFPGGSEAFTMALDLVNDRVELGMPGLADFLQFDLTSYETRVPQPIDMGSTQFYFGYDSNRWRISDVLGDLKFRDGATSPTNDFMVFLEDEQEVQFGKPVTIVDGVWSAPAIEFQNEAGTGIYRNTNYLYVGKKNFVKIQIADDWLRMPTVYSWTISNAANVYVDSAGGLQRSTSSGQFKTNIAPLTVTPEDWAMLRPVQFASTLTDTAEGASDNPYWGFVAEEVPAVAQSDDGENYDVRAIVAMLVTKVKELERAMT